MSIYRGPNYNPARRKLYKLRLGSRYLIFRRGNYSNRRIKPFIERGPFRTFLASWHWGQLEFGLSRWI